MSAGLTLQQRTSRRWLAVIVLAALVARAAWGLTLSASDSALKDLPDQQEYLAVARNVLAGDGMQFYDPRFRQIVYAFRAPGYPLFLAACGGSIRAIRIAQAALDASTVLAVYLLARRWLGTRTSLLAAALAAINPFLIFFSGLILSETLFIAMLAWGMVLLAWRRSFLWGGVLLALSVLVRPEAIAMPLCLGIAAAFVNRDRGAAYHQRWPLPVAASMVLLVAAALFPWALRNRLVLGRWIWTTTNAGITAYDGFNPDATGASDQSFVRSMSLLRQMDEVNRDDYLSQQARQYIRQYPLQALDLAGRKIARTWSPVPLSQQFGRQWVYLVAGLLFSVPLDLLALRGLWRRSDIGDDLHGRPADVGRGAQALLPRSAKVFLLVPAVYLTLAHAVSVGSLRYRLPAEPALAVLAASGALAPRRPAYRLA